jgi:hypothetical protein
MKVTDAIHQKFLHLVLGLDCSVDSAGQVTIQSIDRFWQKYLEFREDWHAQWERRLTCRMNE